MSEVLHVAGYVALGVFVLAVEIGGAMLVGRLLARRGGEPE